MYGYFQVQAVLGISKHPGGLTFTRRLAERCGVGERTALLYVGSGSGLAAAKIAGLTGCEVTGVDLLPEMVRAAQRYARDRVTFLAADAERLPFPDESFDVVLSESVTGFTRRDRSLPEYYRVLRPGGLVGLNEVTWLEEPTADIRAYMEVAGDIRPDSREGWIAALQAARFREIDAETGPLRVLEQLAGEIRMLDRHVLGVGARFFTLLFTDALFRTSLRQMMGSGIRVPKGLLRTVGYGLYVAGK